MIDGYRKERDVAISRREVFSRVTGNMVGSISSSSDPLYGLFVQSVHNATRA